MNRSIHISNFDGLSTRVILKHPKSQGKTFYQTKNGQPVQSVRVIKNTKETSAEALASLLMPEDLIKHDLEIGFLTYGKKLKSIKRAYLQEKDHEICYDFKRQIAKRTPDGKRVTRTDWIPEPPNIDEQTCLSLGQSMLIDVFTRSIVISHTLQVCHTCSLSFDFLYKIANRLNELNSVYRLNTHDNSPIRLEHNGKPYHAFLSGQTYGAKSYLLSLHLSNMELKKP